jgi:lipoprotein-releasing system permease protein
MGFETFIAGRHLMRRRKTGFISLISMISVSGVAIGVMALIVVLAVMSGFDRELKNKIVGVQPHLRIEKVDGIEDADRDLAAIRRHNIPGTGDPPEHQERDRCCGQGGRSGGGRSEHL